MKPDRGQLAAHSPRAAGGNLVRWSARYGARFVLLGFASWACTDTRFDEDPGRGAVSTGKKTTLGSPFCAIRGRVLDRLDRSPVASAAVHASPEADATIPGFPRRAHTTCTDADGAFSIEGLEPGLFRLSAATDLRVSEHVTEVLLKQSGELEIESQPGHEDRVELWVGPGARVSGTVEQYETGQRLPGAWLNLRDAETGETWALLGQSGPNGAFAIGAVRPGSYVLEAHRSEFEALGEGTSVLVANDDVGALSVPMKRRSEGARNEPSVGGVLRGRLVDTRGRAVRNGTVTIEQLGNGAAAGAHPSVTSATLGSRPRVRHAATDQDGQFTLRGLLPTAYSVRVHMASGYAREFASRRRTDDRESPALVHMRQQGETAVEFVVRACEGSIDGVLFREDGETASFARLTLSSGATNLQGRVTTPEVHETRSNKAGRFHFGDLCGETYQLAASHDGHSARQVGVNTGATVVLNLMPSASVLGTVTLGGRSVTRFVAEVAGPVRRVARLETEDGTFSFPWLEPGGYEVSAWFDEGYALANVTFESGAASEVHLQAQRWSTLRGTVTCSNGIRPSNLGVQMLLDRSSLARTGRIGMDRDLEVRSVAPDAAGRFAFERVRAGRVRLTVHDAHGSLNWYSTLTRTEAGPEVGPSPWHEVELGAEQDLDLSNLSVRCRQ